MVQIDTSRDYYADLGLPVNCTTDEAKKQFRKLALKFHPDRHPGEELQYTTQFQAISAAHEILSDPDQRRRYDQIRRQTTYGASTARGPPPQPPRSPAPRGNPYQAHSDFPPPKMRTQTRPAPTGPFGRGGANRYADFPRPPPPPRNETDTTGNARNTSNMFNAWQSMHNTQGQQGHQNDGRHARDSSGASRPAKSSTQRSAWEETYKQQPGSYMRPPPAPPPRQQPQPPPRAQTQPSPQAPTAKIPDPVSSFRRPSADETPYTEGVQRTRTPYASNAGEKTYFSSSSIPRSASTRDSTKLNDDAKRQTSANGHRRRSSSPISGQANTAQDRRPKSRAATGETQSSTPQPSKPFAVYSSTSSDDSDGDSSGSDRAGKSHKKSSSTPRPMANPSSKWSKRGQSEVVATPTEKERSENPIFTIPINDETFVRTSSQNPPPNAANINTNFSPAGIPPLFSNIPPSQSSSQTTGSPTEALPTRGRAGPEHAESAHSSNGVFNSQPRSESGAPTHKDGKFSADGWAKKLQEDNWAAQWAFTPTAVPTPPRNNSSPRRAKPAASRTPGESTPQQQSYNNPSVTPNESQTSYSPSRQRRASHDSNAMDIDPEPPSASDRYAQQQDGTKYSQPRQTFVQPEIPHSPLDAERRASFANLPGPPPGPPPMAGRRVSNSIDLNDLRQVPPLSGATSGGINSLHDMKSGLPFQSQASEKPPPSTKSSFVKSQIELPQPPKGPSPPQDLVFDQWTSYLSRLSVYNTAWNTFNATMVALIQQSAARFVEMDKGQEGGMINGWLGIVGETSNLGGWETYKMHMKQDERTRTYWTVSWEKHMEVMERHDRLRIKATRSGINLRMVP